MQFLRNISRVIQSITNCAMGNVCTVLRRLQCKETSPRRKLEDNIDMSLKGILYDIVVRFKISESRVRPKALVNMSVGR